MSRQPNSSGHAQPRGTRGAWRYAPGTLLLLMTAVLASLLWGRLSPGEDSQGPPAASDTPTRIRAAPVPDSNTLIARAAPDAMALSARGLPAASAVGAEAGGRGEGVERMEAERALQGAFHRFLFEGLPVVDGCLVSLPGTRMPVPFRVTFRRMEHVDAPPGQAMLLATDIQALHPTGPAAPSGSSSSVSMAERCVRRLLGRPLNIPLAFLPAGQDEHSEVLSLLIPILAGSPAVNAPERSLTP